MATNRVDVSSDEVTLLWSEQKVFSPEGDDPGLRVAARELGHTVRVGTTARDHISGPQGWLEEGGREEREGKGEDREGERRWRMVCLTCASSK